MESLVLQLQSDAAGSAVPATELLRKALIVARKLDVPTFREWIVKELEGYPDAESLPQYRRLAGELKAQNPIRGWIPVMFESLEESQAASRAPITQSISELESLVQGRGQLMVRREFLEHVGQREFGPPFPVYLHIGKAGVHSILQNVRTVVLNWSLDLEERGITGAGMAFSSADKQAARDANYVVNNYFSGGGIAQFSHGDHGVQNVHTSAGLSGADVEKLIQAITKAAPPGAHSLELGVLLGQLKDLVAQPNPPKSKIRNALVLLKDTAATAGVTAEVVQQIIELIGKLG